MPQKQPASSQSKRKAKLNTVKLDTAWSQSSQDGPVAKKLRPLSKPPVFDLTLSQESKKVERNPKGKAKAEVPLSGTTRHNSAATDDRLWVDIHEPMTEADLAVHKRKVEDIRRWFVEAFDGGPSGKLKKYRRILALTGPAGTGKTATVRVLARELGFEILEWRNGVDDRFGDLDFEGEALINKFRAFLTRASACTSVLQARPVASGMSSQAPSTHRVILLEDLPNILHGPTQTSFHTALQSLIEASVPVVVIVSDAGLRGEDVEGGTGWRGKEAVDVRTVLGPLVGSPYVTQIAFNPIAPTLLKRAMQALLAAQFKQPSPSPKQTSLTLHSPSKDVVDAIIASSKGDIRSAIMALQFACVHPSRTKGKGTKRGAGAGAMIALTNREQSLQLFHLMGKILYNKRKGDPPNPSATPKDIKREKDIDNNLRDALPLPPWLNDHGRRSSRVNAETLYADTPIDSSLLGLYIHQNYTQFCDEIEHCDGVSEWLSWVDCNAGEVWYQANPHRFHLLTMGTLHSLPSPVTRRSQKFFKPEWFEVAKREKEALDAVTDVREWMSSGNLESKEEYPLSGWSKAAVATELGAILKAWDMAGVQPQAPSSHRTFSNLIFRRAGGENGMHLEEGDTVDMPEAEESPPERGRNARADQSEGGWLESDDIEDF